MDAIQLADKLGKNIKKRRVLMDLSKIELAERSGISSITVRRIEKGDCVGLGLDNLLSIAKVLDVSISQLFQEIEKGAFQFNETPSNGHNILNPLENLTTDQKNLMARLLEEILSKNT